MIEVSKKAPLPVPNYVEVLVVEGHLSTLPSHFTVHLVDHNSGYLRCIEIKNLTYGT